jgi:hypothetical protein
VKGRREERRRGKRVGDRKGGIIYLVPGKVVHTYNPSYSGGRNGKDPSMKPVQAKS